MASLFVFTQSHWMLTKAQVGSDKLQLANPTEEMLGEACDRCKEKVICSTVLRMKFGF